MRYPLIAFFFIFLLPPFTAHALLAGKARIAPNVGKGVTINRIVANADAETRPKEVKVRGVTHVWSIGAQPRIARAIQVD